MQLMLNDLSQADAARASAFVRLGSDRLKGAWSVGTDGAVQLVLYAGESPATIPGTLDVAPYLVRVVDPPWPDPHDVHTLVRPLAFEAVSVQLVVAVLADTAVPLGLVWTQLKQAESLLAAA